MQLTIDSNEPLDRVLRVVGSLYGVEIAVAEGAQEPQSPRLDGPPRTRGRGTAKKSPTRAARPAGRATRRTGRVDLAAVRDWARTSGHAVSSRGRVPNAILAAYEEANPRTGA